jgi:5-methylcytosine-specific restriction endonuclease McrA
LSRAIEKKAYYLANKEARKVYDLANKDKIAARKAAYQKANKGKHNAWVAARKAAKLQQTPSWSESQDIAELYGFATKLDGDFHVDHIVPLQGKLVSGLHVYDNLQILSAADNLTKGNKHESL